MWTFPWHCLDIHVVREIAVCFSFREVDLWIRTCTTKYHLDPQEALLASHITELEPGFATVSVRAVLKAFACMLPVGVEGTKEGRARYVQTMAYGGNQTGKRPWRRYLTPLIISSGQPVLSVTYSETSTLEQDFSTTALLIFRARRFFVVGAG